MNDNIVEHFRKVREELIKRYGGIDGYFKHCQAQERAWAARRKPRRRRKTQERSRTSRST